MPYRFPGAIRKALPTGDYSVEGFESRISIERKSLSDLLGCIGGSRDRFERECTRLATIEFAAMVVEATLSELLTSGRSEIHPTARLGSLCAWSMKYQLPIWFCDDRPARPDGHREAFDEGGEVRRTGLRRLTSISH